MVNRTGIFCLVVFILVSFGGCTPFIDKSNLSREEIAKVQAVRLIEANELNEGSYKFIQKVKGRSRDKFKLQYSLFFSKMKVVEKSTRKKAIEQLKIYAMRAGANAITNLVCLFDVGFPGSFSTFVECQADAILVN